MFVYAYINSEVAFCVKNYKTMRAWTQCSRQSFWLCTITSFISTYLYYISFGLCP